LYALDTKTGQEKWKFKAGNKYTTSPVMAEGQLLFLSGDAMHNRLYVVDSMTGHEKWTYQKEGFTFQIPTVANGHVYLGLNQIRPGCNQVGSDCTPPKTYDDSLYVLDAQTGQEEWKLRLDGYSGDAPIASEGVVYLEIYTRV